jgi:hypothetical protein
MSDRGGYDVYTVKDLIEMEDEEDIWIVKDVIPKAGRILAYGSGGSYKSSLFFDLSVSVASGGMLMETMQIGHYGRVLVISTEGTRRTMRRRLLGHMRSRNVSPEIVELYFGRKPLYLNEPGDFSMFKQLVESIKPVMVVCDPYVNFLSSSENDTDDVKKLTRSLDDLIEENEFAMVFIHHSNMAGNIRGSTVIQGWADTTIKFTVKRKQQVPELPGVHDILTADVDKQRDGPMGVAFSAVPMINPKLGMITFGVFHGMDARMVTAAHLKHEVLKLLRTTRGGFTKTDLCAHFSVGREKMDIALGWLARDKLIQEVTVRKSCGGDRMREITAWATAGIGSRVDAACAIFRAQRQFAQDVSEDAN